MAPPHQAQTLTIVHDDRLVRRFLLASLAWGIAGMAVGLVIAVQLAFWPANLGEYLSFGRLRPVHTGTVVFAFAGNMIFAGIYYSSQRLLRVRLPSVRLGEIHFWSWQVAAAAAAVTLPLGFTQGKEHAEAEWPIDLLISLSWLAFAVQFAAMVRRRNQPRLHMSIWFYIAAIVAVGVLHLVNSLALPVGLLKSYSLFAGVEDAMVQWWYGHGGVTFFLTAPVLGILYYVLPAAAGRPIHSYRLAIAHFWSLIFVFAWASPQNLLNTTLPDWAQSAGVAFAILLWAPSWAGVVNGLLTLRGTRLRSDPVLKFFAAALLFYALAALEAPLLATRTVSSLAHYTDWTIGHVHATALGWVGLVAAGMFYWLVPRLYGARLHSTAAAGAHFYLATVGILVYLSSMWIAGATQGAMLRAEGATGGLAYSFIESLNALRINYWGRVAGGALYLAGFLLMAWNLHRTARAGRPAGSSEAFAVVAAARDRVRGLVFAQPVFMAAAVVALVVAAGFANPLAALGLLFAALFVALGGLAGATVLRDRAGPSWHETLERRGLALTLLVAVTVLLGGAVEVAPLLVSPPQPVPGESEPYSPLQLEGRDVYLAEGCHACHSQMIRPFLWEVARYGEVSSVTESLHDHPFQWGSRRIGPDLARIGGRYPHLWHYQHMIDPRAVSPGSTMPAYPHLDGERVDLDSTAGKMRALRSLGVPYRDVDVERASSAALAEGRAIAADLRDTGKVEVAADSRMVALIAYLQRLGQPPAVEGTP